MADSHSQCIIQRSDINHSPCDDIYALATTVFSSNVIVHKDILQLWYSCNPHIFWLAYLNGNLVGYSSLIPLQFDKFQDVFSADFDEKRISRDNILPFGSASHYLLSSIVVHPDYRKSGVKKGHRCSSDRISRDLRILMLHDLLQQHNFHDGSFCIVGEAITREGEFMLQSLGLTFHSEKIPGCKVYSGKLSKDSVIPVLRYSEANHFDRNCM